MSAEEFFERQEKKEKLRKRLQLAAIPLYYLIYIPLMVLCWHADSEYIFSMLILALVPGIYYLFLFKADLLFELHYMFNLTIEDPKPSEWYYMTSSFSAYAFMVIGLLLPLLAYLYALAD